MNNGWIKLHRKLLDWEWYSSPETTHFFIYLLLKAVNEDCCFKGMQIKRGDAVICLHQASKDTGLSIQTIRTCLKRLQSTNEITTTSTNKFTVITIVNYSDYQNNTVKTNKQLTNNQQTKPQKSTNKLTNKSTNKNSFTNIENTITPELDDNQTNKQTNKQINKQPTNKTSKINNIIRNKEYNNITPLYNIPPYIRVDLWNAYLEMRKKIRKPATEKAKELAIKKLERFYKKGEDPNLILEQSILHSWQGLFPVKQKEIQKQTLAFNEDTEFICADCKQVKLKLERQYGDDGKGRCQKCYEKYLECWRKEKEQDEKKFRETWTNMSPQDKKRHIELRKKFNIPIPEWMEKGEK